MVSIILTHGHFDQIGAVRTLAEKWNVPVHAHTLELPQSMLSVLSQKVEINGPPKYFTPDWERAAESVRTLAGLRPSVAPTGHGQPMVGDFLRQELDRLAREFESLAVPRTGRYLAAPAIADENGVVALPPPVADPAPWIVAGIAVATITAIALLIATSEAQRCSVRVIIVGDRHRKCAETEPEALGAEL